MLTLQKLTGSASGTASYMLTTEYYRTDDMGLEILPDSQWLGKGVEAFGLNDVGRDANLDFENMLLGYHPKTHEKLVQNAGEDGRIMGIDLTFSAEKYVTILLVEASPEERKIILDIQRKATDYCLEQVASEIKSRTGAQGKTSIDGDIVVRSVVHLDSRNGDPQLHTHNVLLNVMQCTDGKTRTLDMEPVFEMQKALGAVHRSLIAKGIHDRLGLSVYSERMMDADGNDTGEIYHHVEGIEKTDEREFSSRRIEIEKLMAEENIGAQEANKRTRQDKDDALSPAQIILNAREKMNAMREDGRLNWTTITDLKERKSVRDFVSKTDADIMEDMHKMESAWSRYDLIERISKERFDVEDIVVFADRFIAEKMASSHIKSLSNDEHGRARFCSQAQWDLEASIITSGLQRMNDETMRLRPEMVDKSITAHEAKQGFALTQEQRNAVHFIACNTGGLACLSGRAGTGKTATAGAYIGAFIDAGFTVIGTSTSQAATEKLEAEAGIRSENTKSILTQIENGKLVLTAKTVLIVDEAGMVGAKTLRSLQKHVDAAGGKMILVGDYLQLQPIESGSPFRALTAKIGEVTLAEIRRQKNVQERAVAMAFYKGASGQSIVEGWKKTGELTITHDRDDGVKKLVMAYFANTATMDKKLILAQSHVDCDAVTKVLRDHLKVDGQITNMHQVTTIDRKSGEKTMLEVGQGDRIRFTKNAKWLGIANNDIATVVGFHQAKEGLQITVRLESEVAHKNGKEITIPTWKYNRMVHGYASTIHAAQGQGKDDVYWLARGNKAMDRSMGMVAFTRTKEHFHVFATEKDSDVMAARMDTWGKKMTAEEMSKPMAIDPALAIEKSVASFEKKRMHAQDTPAQQLQIAQEKYRAEGRLMAPSSDNATSKKAMLNEQSPPQTPENTNGRNSISTTTEPQNVARQRNIHPITYRSIHAQCVQIDRTGPQSVFALQSWNRIATVQPRGAGQQFSGVLRGHESGSPSNRSSVHILSGITKDALNVTNELGCYKELRIFPRPKLTQKVVINHYDKNSLAKNDAQRHSDELFAKDTVLVNARRFHTEAFNREQIAFTVTQNIQGDISNLNGQINLAKHSVQRHADKITYAEKAVKAWAMDHKYKSKILVGTLDKWRADQLATWQERHDASQRNGVKFRNTMMIEHSFPKTITMSVDPATLKELQDGVRSEFRMRLYKHTLDGLTAIKAVKLEEERKAKAEERTLTLAKEVALEKLVIARNEQKFIIERHAWENTTPEEQSRIRDATMKEADEKRLKQQQAKTRADTLLKLQEEQRQREKERALQPKTPPKFTPGKIRGRNDISM